MNKYYKVKIAIHYLLVIVVSPISVPAIVIAYYTEKLFERICDWVGYEDKENLR